MFSKENMRRNSFISSYLTPRPSVKIAQASKINSKLFIQPLNYLVNV
jgi:hypothetical protein